jgi:hypothetical protein
MPAPPGTGSWPERRVDVCAADLSSDMTLSVVVRDWWLTTTREHYPDLADQMPFARSARCEWLRASGRVVLRLTDDPAVGYNHGGPFAVGSADWAIASGLADGRTDLESLLNSPEWYSPTVFTYVGPVDEQNQPSPPHIMATMSAWAEALALPRVNDLNRARVARAIPAPPTHDIARLISSIVVVDDGATRQGTAFRLDGVGYVTCAHVMAAGSKVHVSATPGTQHSIAEVRSNDDLDLAVFEVPTLDLPSLRRGSADSLAIHDHLLILGFPNYRLGDSGVFNPGLVVGFRPRHGVRRILTDAYIVGGMSGAPAIGAAGDTVGVVATGADSWPEADDTEDRGIIPIDALSLL